VYYPKNLETIEYERALLKSATYNDANTKDRRGYDQWMIDK
jgi:hypothetical protein